VRYAPDEFGRINAEHAELSYKICGKICSKLTKSSSNQTEIAGRNCGGYSASLELLVIMSENDIASGDVISDGEYHYRIVGQICDTPTKFGLERIELPNYAEKEGE
jgi:hypothetical protein